MELTDLEIQSWYQQDRFEELIVVAQHGASLGNLVRCRQDALVMEIIDPQLRAPIYEALARRHSLNFISIPQANNHAEIDIDSVASIIFQKYNEYTNLL